MNGLGEEAFWSGAETRAQHVIMAKIDVIMAKIVWISHMGVILLINGPFIQAGR